MTITPIDIQQYKFRTRAFGYEKSGVDQYLEQIAEELENYHRQVQELKEELARTKADLQDMRQREATVKDTLLTAQQVTEELKANAHREAEIALAEAELEAERIVHAADNRRLQLLNEIQEIKRQKVTFESALRGLVESHLRMLDLATPAIEADPAASTALPGPLAGDRLE